jgi:rRNA maturation endonuclease Nob1
MKLVVHDASILIDLVFSKTVEAWFATNVETWTTELVYPREIEEPSQRALFNAYADAGKLQIRHINSAQLEQLVRARTRLGLGLSLADVSVLQLTRELGENALLATGDRLLRATAEREKIKACGLLGLFDIMVTPSRGGPAALPYAVAIEKLEQLMALPECRLPADKCHAKIRDWKSKGGKR